MGFRKVYEAPITYREGQTCQYSYGTGWFTDSRYNEDYFAGKVTKETLLSVLGQNMPPSLWCRQSPLMVGDQAVSRPIYFASIVDQICWPGWNVTCWVIDGLTGATRQRRGGEMWEPPLGGFYSVWNVNTFKNLGLVAAFLEP